MTEDYVPSFATPEAKQERRESRERQEKYCHEHGIQTPAERNRERGITSYCVSADAPTERET
jgi:hypothetical protein